MEARQNVYIDIGPSQLTALVGLWGKGGKFQVNFLKSYTISEDSFFNSKINSSLVAILASLKQEVRSDGLKINWQQLRISLTHKKVRGLKVTSEHHLNDHTVTWDLKEMLASAEYEKKLPAGYEVIERVENGHYLDDRYFKHFPIDEMGEVLRVEYFYLLLEGDYLGQLNESLQRSGLKAEVVKFKGQLLSQQIDEVVARDGFNLCGKIICHLSEDTCEVMLWLDAKIEQAGVIPIGHRHFVQDLMQALKLGYSDAHRLIKEMNSGVEKIQVSDPGLFDEVVSSRLEELMRMISKLISHAAVVGEDKDFLVCGQYVDLFSSQRARIARLWGKSPISVALDPLEMGSSEDALGLTRNACLWGLIKEDKNESTFHTLGDVALKHNIVSRIKSSFKNIFREIF